MNTLYTFTQKLALLVGLFLILFNLTFQGCTPRLVNQKQTPFAQLRQDTAQAEAWRRAAKIFLKSARYDSALVYLQQAADKYAPLLQELEDTSLWKNYLQINNQMGSCYWRLGAYPKSKEHLNHTLEQVKKYLGEKHLLAAEGYGQLGIVHDIMGEYDKAGEYQQKALAIKLATVGEEHVLVADTYNVMAILHWRQGQYEEALDYFNKALVIQQSALEENHISIGITHSNMGMIYNAQGTYEKALKNYQKALNIYKTALGETHINVSNVYSNIGNNYIYQGMYKEAIKYLQKALDIALKSLNETHPDLAYIYGGIGDAHRKLGAYEEALENYQKTLTINRFNFGEKHQAVATSYFDMGVIYKRQGFFEKALNYYQKALDILSTILEPHHPHIAATYENIANVYREQGLYKIALENYQKTLKIRLKTLKEEHPEIADSYTNIGVVYELQGVFDKALDNYQKALAIQQAALEENHPDIAITYNNIAVSYRYQGLYEAALENCQKALAINLAVLGEKHEYSASVYYNIGSIFKDQKKFKKALSYFQKVQTIDSAILGEKHPNYARDLDALGLLYTQMGDYEEAESLLLQAKAIFEEVLSEEHPDYAKSLDNLGKLYSLTERYEEAASYYLKANKANKRLVTKGAFHLSENELTAYTQLFINALANYYSFTQIGAAASRELLSMCFENALFHKGFLLNTSSQVNKLALSDSIYAEKVSQLKAYRRRLAAEYTKPVAERQQVKQIEEQANTLEKELVQTIAGLNDALRQVNWQEIQTNLQPGETAIEFVHYKFYSPDPTDSTFYAALILRPEDKSPHFIPLFEEKELQRLLNQEYNNRRQYLTDLYTQPPGKVKTSLYDLVWRPLENLLQDSRTLYISPSGLLHRLNLGAIMVKEKQSVSDRSQIITLGSTRQLAIKKAQGKEQGFSAQIYGGVHYDMDSLALIRATARYANDKPASSNLSFAEAERSERGNNWNYLPGAKLEAEKIAALIEKSGGKPRLLKDYWANEESFKQLGRFSPSPRILHLATHGYFYPNLDEKDRQASNLDKLAAFKTSDNPMIRSGLILAGGNYKWKTDRSLPGMEDGVLTAYEVSQVNLRNTELVVLSACDTGLGDIVGNEGVYGLQRAFKIAGAKNLVMSLWKVPDEQTQEMMTAFYRFWLEEKKSISDAFQAAQQAMRRKYKEHYYWAGFVLIE